MIPREEAESPFANDAPFAAPADSRPTPQLGIIHLMMLTAAAAVLMLPTRQAMQTDYGDEKFRILVLGQQFVSAAIMAIPLASLGGWLLAWRRKERFPVEPGHYLLILLGVSAIIQTTFGVLWYTFRNNQLTLNDDLQMVMLGVYSAMIVGYALIAAGMATVAIEEGRWKVAFGLIALNHLVDAFQYAFIAFGLRGGGSWFGNFAWITSFMTMLSSFAVLAAIVVMLIMDLRGRRRDWLHWTGLTCFLLSDLVYGLWFLVAGLLM